MCYADQAEREAPTMAPAGYSFGSKRPLAEALREDDDHETRTPKRAHAGAIVPYVAPPPDEDETAAGAVMLAAAPAEGNLPAGYDDAAMVLYVVAPAAPPIDDQPINAVPFAAVAPQLHTHDVREAPAAPPIDAQPISAVPFAAVAPQLHTHDVREAPAALPIDAQPISAVPFASVAPQLHTHDVREEPAAPPIDAQPINAVPLAAVAPQVHTHDVREAPAWMRKVLLAKLKLRFDLPVHFIDEKIVTKTDLDPHQNRFRLPTDGVQRRLLPILTADEAAAANLLFDAPPRARAPRRQPERNAVVADGEQGPPETKTTRTKKKGKKHGGLAVTLVHLTAGSKNLQLSQWDSSHGTIIKGEGYLDFIRACGFQKDDVVQVWAFKEREFRYFGAIFCKESPLYIVLVGPPSPQLAVPPPPPPPLPVCTSSGSDLTC